MGLVNEYDELSLCTGRGGLVMRQQKNFEKNA